MNLDLAAIAAWNARNQRARRDYRRRMDRLREPHAAGWCPTCLVAHRRAE